MYALDSNKKISIAKINEKHIILLLPFFLSQKNSFSLKYFTLHLNKDKKLIYTSLFNSKIASKQQLHIYLNFVIQLNIQQLAVFIERKKSVTHIPKFKHVPLINAKIFNFGLKYIKHSSL